VLVLINTVNNYQNSGSIFIEGLHAKVKVVRDEKGMAYIYADDLHDALMAQGFITAQDRLFQMELTRMFAQGRICELAGEKAKELDTRMRTLGFHRNAKKHAKILNDQSRAFFQAYADGVNQYIERQAAYHHVEFRLAGIKPTRWKIDDIFSILYYMGWDSAANMKTEIVAQMLIEKLGTKAREIFPININPEDPAQLSYNQAAAGSALPAAIGINIQEDKKLMAILKEPSSLSVGSNNWVLSPSKTKSGKAMVCNDTHLPTNIIPGPMYALGLITPEFRAIGLIVPGLPGMIAGKTEHTALGITNSYGDAQDLYIETIDPDDNNNYLEGEKSIAFEIIKETLKIKDDESEKGFREEGITIRLSKRGPVISDVMPGLKTDKVITMRWAPFETMHSSTGLEKLMLCKNVYDIKKELSKVSIIMLNFVFADIDGNIAWQSSGRLPIRFQGESTVPYMVNSKQGKWTDNWTGWIPFEEMPSSYNPDKGWLGNANNKTVFSDYPYYISSYCASYYRYARMMELFTSKDKISADDSWQFQRDIKNKMAEKLAPLIGKVLSKRQDTQKMGEILLNWDFLDRKEDAAPAIMQTVYTQMMHNTFKDELGDELHSIMMNNYYFWQIRFEKMILDGDSAWFDDKTTEKKESMDDIILASAREVLDKYGSDPEKYVWGDLHQMGFVSAIMRKGALKYFMGKGPYPMDGSGETLYRASYNFTDPYEVSLSSAMRMVVDLADKDKVMAVVPSGTSGRIFDPHFKDQADAYMNGEKIYWWFSDSMIKEHTESEYALEPFSFPEDKQ
jgi:penicillin G amidase